ncbi:MAG: 30S ribosomal protein S17 [Myxococcota bacterium]|nr:30S ribosomal protein S17 [Myxococcota bacterium]
MEANSEATPAKRTRKAVVLKCKMDKTAVVEVTRRFRHRKYLKFVKRKIRYSAHDAMNECKIGDIVLIEETRPLSKNKRWRVRQIIEKASV